VGKRVTGNFEILERPTYTAILLCVIGGKNYATSIARALGKRQPTVTEQLKELERANLIKPLKRGKSQKYEVNWNILFKRFYGLIGEVFSGRMDDLHLAYKEEIRKIKRLGWRKLVPPELFKAFLKEYSSIILSFGGMTKSLNQIIFSFFAALNNLEEKLWKKLVKEFKVDEKSLALLANLMEFELFGIELSAIESYLTLKGADKDG